MAVLNSWGGISMIRFKSNIKEVIAQLERLPGEVHAAMQRAVEPKRWTAPALIRAEQALLMVATPAQRQLIPTFVNAIRVTVFIGAGGKGFEASLAAPQGDPTQDAAQTLVQGVIVQEAELRKKSDLRADILQRQMPAFMANRERISEAILDWVKRGGYNVDPDDPSAGKLYDADRDMGYSPEQIAVRLEAILFGKDQTRSGSPKVADARAGLSRRLYEYMAAQMQEEMKFDAVTVNLWLNAVLMAWREMVLDLLPAVVRQELKGLQNL